MLPFLRPDLAELMAYTPHPGSHDESAVPPVLDRLDTNECPFDMPEELKQKLGWLYQHELESNRYPDGGHATLKGAIAHYVMESASPAVDWVTEANITVGNGSDELIRSVLIATCLGNCGRILVAHPTFSMYGILANTLGIPVHTIGRSDASFEMNLDAASAAIAQFANDPQPIRAVFVVNPNSPTANALTNAEIAWLKTLPDSMVVVVDEAYFEFCQQTVVAELATRPNWIILRTFSKAFRLAAHRVGYAVAHPDFIATLEKVRLPYNLPSLSQAGAAIALSHRQELLSVIPLLLQERDRLFQALSAHPAIHVWPTDANFLYFRVQTHPDYPLTQGESSVVLETLFHRMRSLGTLIRHTGGGIRLTVGTPEENQRTLERLEQALRAAL
jgi:histidinol-phosphate aminotransferase